MKKRNITILSTAIIIIVAISITLPIVIINYRTFKLNLTDINPVEMGPKEWLEDFNYLYDFIDDNYPLLWVKERQLGFNWLDLHTTMEQKINNVTTNTEFFSEIMQFVIALQNRHSYVLPPAVVKQNHINFANWDPFNIVFCEVVDDAASYWNPLYNNAYSLNNIGQFNVKIAYDRGCYVIVDGIGDWQQIYGNGTKIVKVNNIDVDTAIKSCYFKDYIDYDYVRSKPYIWQISPHSFGSTALFTLQNTTGYIWDTTFTLLAGQTITPYEYPKEIVNTTKFEAEKIGYMYVKTFNTPEVEPYYEQVMNFYSEIEDYNHLIVDIRGNTGGFYSAWIDGIVQPLIQETTPHNFYIAYRMSQYTKNLHRQFMTEKASLNEFSYLPPEVSSENFGTYFFYGNYAPTGMFNFTGDISILVDNVVYSASEGFVNFCKENSFATIYGTATGGDGLMVYPIFCVLPNSKIVINLANGIGLDLSGHSNEEYRTQPDVHFESAFGNFTELIDYTINDLLSS